GNLQRQSVSRGTLLTSYNGGQGVGTGSFTITNSKGQTATLNLATLKPTTIGDVIDAINSLSLGVQAKINDAGDGIALVDTAGGAGALSVADQGSGQTAAKLHLAGTAINGTLDGSTTFKIQLAAGDSLDTLVTQINALNAGVSASTLNDGA